VGKRVLVLVGTKNGVFILESNEARKNWQIRGPYCNAPVRDVKYDPATGAIYAAGPQVHSWDNQTLGVWKSTDLGETWTHHSAGITFGEAGPKLEKVWHIMPAHGALYLGTDPAGIFKSTDGGQTWTHLKGLREHPTCPHWQPGNGGLCLHSVVPHPTDPKKMWTSMSSVGVFYTEDGGETWEVRNKGLTAPYPVDETINIGYCVHKFERAPGDQDILYMQHHDGVSRSLNGGLQWEDISEGLPARFGFGCVVHPHNPKSFYVIPIQDNGRYMPGGQAAVYRADDYGNTWTRLYKGLPQEHAYFETLREGMAVDTLDRHGIYFGTNNGFVWASNDEGENWTAIAQHLPYVWSVNTAVIEE
jgi:photosystem II stability/assembly factor-like uncharacterized protein